MARPVRLISGFVTVGAWTFLSRIFGFARDILIAAFLGAGPVAEAFLVAFALPNMFRRFFAEGAFNTAFVPMFSKRLESGENPQGFAQDAFAGLATVLIVFTVIAQVAMPALVFAMASGFAEDNRFDLAVLYGRICFPYIVLISLAALLSGVLNAAGRFVAAAAAPVLLNIALVGALLLGDAVGWPPGLTLVWTVPVGGILQLAVVWIAASRAGFTLIPRLPRLTPEMKRLGTIMGPAMLAGGVVQVNLLVGRQVASFFDGAIAWLSYADRLYQLPLGVVGIAIGVVLLPDLSRRLRASDDAGGRDALSRAAEFALVLTVPCTIAFLVIPMPLVATLFQRGAFDADDTAATALVLAVYGLGLPAFVLQKVWQPLYFAREDTRTPFRFALVALVVNAVVAIALAPVIGFIAAALGTTVAAWFMAIQLILGARRMGEVASPDDRFRRRWPRIVAASVLMGVVVWVANVALAPLFVDGWKFLALAILVATGIVSFFGAGQLLGAVSFRELRGTVRR
ncbi:putative peptidoglycan biosynthesis protein MurJ [Rhodobacteraceae bacterium THAF1]|uniref:murein biosynthesis integral membrane protein MurJ n=1 Tax=Palleronia sp. THAF1 TaxID=2587842 RepID=UPI000F3B5355|nr:murein biosynthesis integral membrane protein MurJ [Palleronia sp. THAF1]QFU09435.1 putative peptidoglycan biosynthesis protein MurJ [Palleronia sp. THAF1]VDC21915.1 putative peptidoglycan biosynthesis protein MurJ [Rhodobacteraceae bacterium THAF1]